MARCRSGRAYLAAYISFIKTFAAMDPIIPLSVSLPVATRLSDAPSAARGPTEGGSGNDDTSGVDGDGADTS